jgi:hypothetical protein
MQTNRPNISELASQLQQALDAARAENEELTQRTDQAEKRAIDAEKRAAEIQEKLTILESLKSREYQTVVTELFEGPSKRAARLTLIVAVSSIIVGLIATVVSNRIAERNQSQAIANFASSVRSQTAEEVNKSEQRTQEDLAKKLHALPIPGSSQLENNTVVNLTVGNKAMSYFVIAVPEGTNRITFILRSLTKDADLFVRYGELPKLGQKDEQGKSCHSDGVDIDQCAIDNPTAGNWYMAVWGYDGPANVSVRVSY